MKNLVKVAYWDTEQHSQPPALLGEIKGTPTIRAFVPDRKSSNNRKQPLEYNSGREVKELERFAVRNMPSYVELVDGEDALSTFSTKAAEWGLPQVLVFSKSKSVSSILKTLSVEYRRRLIIAQLTEGTRNAAIARRYSVTKYPSIIALQKDEEPTRFQKDPTYNRLDSFLRKVALRKPVLAKPTRKEEL